MNCWARSLSLYILPVSAIALLCLMLTPVTAYGEPLLAQSSPNFAGPEVVPVDGAANLETPAPQSYGPEPNPYIPARPPTGASSYAGSARPPHAVPGMPQSPSFPPPAQPQLYGPEPTANPVSGQPHMESPGSTLLAPPPEAGSSAPPQQSPASIAARSTWSTLASARQLVRSGKSAQASQLVEQFISSRPAEPEGYFWRGVILDNMNRPEDALAAFQQATELSIKSGMDSAELRMNRANALLKLGRNDEAIAEYKRAESVDPELGLAALNLGRAFIQIGDYAEALKCFQRCDALHFQPLQLAYYRAKALRGAGRVDEAKTQLSTALSRSPANEMTRSMRREFADLLRN